ncbi:hypothetical protein Tco_0763627, partial [Tanacetum coccineum]
CSLLEKGQSTNNDAQRDNLVQLDLMKSMMKKSSMALMGYRNTFSPSTSNNYSTTTVESYGNINIKHLYGVAANTRDHDFDLKMRMTAYWKMVLKRLVDWVALHLCFVLQKVPECIEKLTHAGIKIWVLTGHKDMYCR